jgi:hypothetical protein
LRFFWQFEEMNLKKLLPLLPVLLLAGCALTGSFTRTTFTLLTPDMQPRNANNLYPVEVAFNSPQQSLRWDSIQPFVVVNGQPLPLHAVPMVENRWEGLVPVPASGSQAAYRFKFDYLYNSFGTAPKTNSVSSSAYTLKIMDQ